MRRKATQKRKRKEILQKRNHLRNKLTKWWKTEAEIRSKYEDIYIYFTNFRKKRSLVYLRKEEMDNNIQVYISKTNVIVDDLFFMI